MTDKFANKPWQQVPMMNANERFGVKSRLEPKVDAVISKIVGFNVFQTDPRLLKLIAGWKNKSKEDMDREDNYLQNPDFIKELKEVFVKPL